MIEMTMLPVNLHLFEGEGGGEGGEGGTQETVPGITRRGKSGEYDNVVFGKQATENPDAGEEPEVQVTSNTLEERRKAYRDMVTGEYKEFYDKDVQHLIKQRLKGENELKRQVGEMQPIIDMLSQKYQVSDLSQLAKAIDNDDVYWSEAAEEAGMTVEQYKQFQKLQRENAALLQQQRMRQGQAAANQQMQAWYQQAEQAKEIYPNLDLSAEAQNPQFLSMLKAGVPVQHAYEVVHMDDIKAGIQQMTAKATEKQVTANVRARGSRPQENGATSQGAFTVKSDVSKLTKKDRAEIVRRAQRGDHIEF